MAGKNIDDVVPFAGNDSLAVGGGASSNGNFQKLVEEPEQDVGEATPNDSYLAQWLLKKKFFRQHIRFFVHYLMFCIVIFGSGSIAAIYMLLNTAPFKQMVWGMMLFTGLFWAHVALFLVTWFVFAKMLDPDNLLGNCDLLKRIVFRWRFAFVACWVIVVVMGMFTTLVFQLPDTFFSSENLSVSRIASVSHSQAKFHMHSRKFTEPVVIEYWLPGNTATQKSGTTQLLEEYDYNAFITVNNLAPNTLYMWKSNLPGAATLNFTTFPAPGTKSKFSFYFGSCFQHNFPNFHYAPGFKYIEEKKPTFIAFLGDFIYSDLPWFAGTGRENFLALYRQTFLNPMVASALSHIPNFFMYDDHEIINDWDEKTTGMFPNAVNSWDDWLGKGNPITYPSLSAPVYYFAFDYGDVAFFYPDTRMYRDPHLSEDKPSKTMLGAKQKQALKDWLLAKNNTATFKFIMSTIAFTTEFTPYGYDCYGGYVYERDEIFDFIRDNNIQGVAVFTGDSHFSYTLELQFRNSNLYEFSSSPLSAFDNSLGGFFPSYPWRKPESELASGADMPLWYGQGTLGWLSFVGIVEVDTTGPIPTFTVKHYKNNELAHTDVMTINNLKPGPKPANTTSG